MNVSPLSVDVKDYKSRWGGCHFDGRIYYNWKIIIAPHSIVDYVVVHELCHLVYDDHSMKFWKLLGSVLPDYGKRKEWLKNNPSAPFLTLPMSCWFFSCYAAPEKTVDSISFVRNVVSTQRV